MEGDAIESNDNLQTEENEEFQQEEPTSESEENYRDCEQAMSFIVEGV